MSPRSRSIVLWASLMLTSLAAACGDTTAPPLPKCYLDQTGLVDTGCDPNAVIEAPGTATRPAGNRTSLM